MRTEDVVRMLVTGASTSETVAAIRSRDVDFDLSTEMLDELRVAGVPGEVIEAMTQRQAELHPPPVAEIDEIEPEPPESGLPLVVLKGDLPRSTQDKEEEGDDESERALYFPGALPPPIVRALEVGDGSEPAEVSNVAVFVACRTAYHVPDYWRSKSPLGRDFVSMPRHRMLAFLRGNDRVEKGELPTKKKWHFAAAPAGTDFLRLELPPTLEVQLDPGEAHDLMIGLAVEVDGRFVRLVSDERDGVAVESGSTLDIVAGNGDAGDGFGIVTAFAD
jgi:hypothetical protein